MKKSILIILAAVLIAGCENIKHKTFRLTSSATGGKISLLDSTGTNPTPMVILGAFTQSVTTLPPNVKAEYESTSYELFSGHPLFTEKMKITTVNGTISITDQKTEYHNEKGN